MGMLSRMRWRKHIPRWLDWHSLLANQTNGLQDGSQIVQVIENMAEREGFEPSVQVLARTTV